jgi:hypothetical protein
MAPDHGFADALRRVHLTSDRYQARPCAFLFAHAAMATEKLKRLQISSFTGDSERVSKLNSQRLVCA